MREPIHTRIRFEAAKSAPALSSALVLVAALGASDARASDLDQFGFGARPMSMGNAFTALATDYTGTYYNPAGIAAGRTLSVGGGFSYADYALKFKSETGRFDDDASRITPLSAFTVGIASALGEENSLLGRLGVGIGLLLPTRQIVGAEVQTAPGIPQYFLYGSRRDKIGILPAAAFRVLPLEGTHQVLAVGAGVTILSDINGSFVFDLSSSPSSSVAVKEKLTWDMAPNLGIYYWPIPEVSLGIVYRGELSLKADFDVVIDLDGDGVSDFPLGLEAVTLFEPHEVALGLAIDPVEPLTVAIDLTYQNWSAFEDPFVTIEPILGQWDPRFEDVFVPRVGVEWRFDGGFALRAGYYFQPTPIPEQRGRTNLIDLDKHVFSFGAGYAYWTQRDQVVRDGEQARIESREWNPLSIDLFFQWHHLLDAKVSKEIDPGTGQSVDQAVGAFYEAGGEIVHVGLMLTLRF